MTPLWRRRLAKFKANKRGFYSFWIFSFLFIVTLGADFIANERPLVIYYKQDWYFPVFKDYPETMFGGELETTAEYRDPVVKELINKHGWMIWPLIPFDYTTINYELNRSTPAPPSSMNWLGTDDQGRDLLARLIYGYRISIIFGLLVATLASIIGVIVGAIQGYFGGAIDLICQRLIEIWSGLPILYVLIIISSVFTPNFSWLLLVLLLFSWMTLVGVVRAEFFRTRTLDYVKAAETLGVSTNRIIWRHILPNAMVATISYMPFIVSMAITTLTSLDFLGFGFPPGSASLGEILTQGKNNIHAPWLGLAGFLSLSILLSLLIFIGEAVRDALDPRHA